MIQSQLMNSVHLLTATSQGVQHWAGYQQHISLMFEVFGESRDGRYLRSLDVILEYLELKFVTLSNNTITCYNSGTLTSQIEQGEMGAKMFTLQAVDGPLSCLFWEIVCHPTILFALLNTCRIIRYQLH